MYVKKTTVITYPLRKCEDTDEAYKQLAAVVVTNSAADYIGAIRKLRRSVTEVEVTQEMLDRITEITRYVAAGIGYETTKVLMGVLVRDYIDRQNIAEKTRRWIVSTYEDADDVPKMLALLDGLRIHARNRNTRYIGVRHEAEKDIVALEEFFHSNTFRLYSCGKIDTRLLIKHLKEVADKEAEEDEEFEVDEEGIGDA